MPIVIIMLLLFTAIATPYRIALFDIDEIGWLLADSLVDLVFFVDIVLNFFMAYYDMNEELVDGRGKIACRYLKGWFAIDIFSVIPISLIMNTGNYNALARIARLPKLYKLVKVFRLVKVMKVVKERNTLIKYVNELFKLSAGFERLIFFIIIFLVLCHISSCFWIILTKINEDEPVSWLTVGNY